MDWIVYGDLDFMADILNGVALLVAGVGGSGGDFTGLLELALLVGALSTVVTGLATQGRISWIPLLATFVVFMALLGPKRTVTMESVYTAQTRTVANIPIGVAVTGSVLSRIGYFLTQRMETVFSYPGLTTEGFQESLETWRVLRQSALNPSTYSAANTVGGGDFARSWVNYVSTCTAFGLDIGNLDPSALENATLAHLAVLNPNPALGAEVFVGGATGSNLNCVQAHAQLLLYSRTQFIPALKNTVLRSLLFRQQREQTPTLASLEGKITAMRTLAGSAVSNDEFLLSLYVGTLYDFGLQRRFSLDGRTDYSIMIGDAIRARNAQWKAQGDLFTIYALPALGFLEGFFYAMIPLVIVMAAMRGPSGIQTVGRFMLVGMWIQLWAPCLSLVNLYLFHAVAGDLANLDGAALVTSSIAGAFSADSVVQQYMATAGLFASLTPFLALAIITGSVYTLNNLASQLSGPDTIAESTAARPVKSNDALYQGLPHFGLDASSGARGMDAATLLPTYQAVSTRSESMQSAMRETAGARTSYLQSVDRALTQSSGSEGRSFSEGVFSDSTASRSSDLYQFMRTSGLDDASKQLQSYGLTQTESLNYTAGAAIEAGGNGGMLSAKSALARELSDRIGVENTSSFASSVKRAMSENDNSSAELAHAISNDQRRGWSESGYTSSGFTQSQSVRESGERFAASERSFEQAVASAASTGASQTLTTPFLSQQIAGDRSQMNKFENGLRANGLFGEAMRWADMYRSQDLFPPGEQGRHQAVVAGGLKAMKSAGRDDLLDAALAPFGMDHVGTGDPAAHRGVGESMGSGPSVSVPTAAPGDTGYAGRGGVPTIQDVAAAHGMERGALQAEAEGSARRMVEGQGARAHETQTKLHEDQSVPSMVAGQVSNYLDATAGAVKGMVGGDEGWAEHVDGFREHALSRGLTPVQAELFAYDKSTAGMMSASPDLDYRDSLVDNVLSEYEGLPRTGHAALKMVERAVNMTDAGAEGPLGELKVLNESLELHLPREQRGLAGRTAP